MTFPPMMTHASALSATLTPVSDATISIIAPSMNFGHDNTLSVEYQSSRQISRALIRFNLAAALPSNAVIDSAWLNLKLEGGQGSGSLTIYLVTQDWIEGQVTWDSQPTVGEPILSRPCDTTTGVKGLEITDIVRAWHNTPHYGLEIRGPEGGVAYIRLFESREHGEYPPTLSVIYHLPSPSPSPTPTPLPTQAPTQPPVPTPTAGPTQGWCCLNGEVFQTTQAICSL
ncbi:DNRLRE domain-containing protein, partial [Chloroflexota bacterium]